MGGLNDHGWLDEELTYEEFKTALEPYCKPVGRYPERNASSMVLEGTVWREAWALDLRRIDKGPELEPVKPVDQQAGPRRRCPTGASGSGLVRIVVCRWIAGRGSASTARRPWHTTSGARTARKRGCPMIWMFAGNVASRCGTRSRSTVRAA